MLNLKKMLTKISDKLSELEPYKYFSSSSSFTNAYPDSTSHRLRYLGEGLDTIRTGISSYSSGIIQLATTGPRYGVVLYKYTNQYFSGYVISYNEECPFVRFSYANGKCSILITSGGALLKWLKGSIFNAFSHRRKAVASC